MATYQSSERNPFVAIYQSIKKMIPSLRYLCLEKVIAQDEDYTDLPEILVKDINLMKVFNGTYSYSPPPGSWETTEVKIFYDGKVWSFKFRTWDHESDGEDEDGKWVCYCKYCWDTTGSKAVDFTVKEGEVFQPESSFLDFIRIWRPEQEKVKVYGWKFEVDLPSDDDKYPFLVKTYGEVKSLGAISFHGVGHGESVCGRFQVEVVNSPEKEGWFGLIPAREWTYLHLEVTGLHNHSELYSKYESGFERRHISMWRDPTSGEVHRGVSAFARI